MRYETSVDVVSRHVLIAVLRKDAHHIPAARRRSVRQQGWCWAGVPEQYQSISPTAPAPVSLRRPTHRHIPAQRAQLPRFHTERHNQDTTRSMMGEKHRSRRRARLAMAALPEAAHGSTSTRPHRRQALPTALPSAPAQARPAPAAPPSERRPKATVTASSSDSRGGAGRGCQSSTRGVAVVTACFGRLCCGARSSFAPSAATASSTRRSVTKTNIISKHTTYLWGPGRPPAVGNLLPAEPLVGTNPQDNSARAPSR